MDIRGVGYRMRNNKQISGHLPVDFDVGSGKVIAISRAQANVCFLWGFRKPRWLAFSSYF